MDTRELECFVAAYRHGSINQAAKDLFLSPQGLGKALKRLESDLGVVLFERTRNGLSPTPQADILFERSEVILKEMAELADAMQGRVSQQPEIKVAMTYGAQTLLGIDAITQFEAAHPEALLDIVELPDDGVDALLREGKATIGIIRNTVLYNLLFLFLGTALAVALAILLNEVKSKNMGKLYQSLILIPYLMSWVIASYLVYAFLAQDIGIVNNSILKPLGKEAVSWYSEKKYWPYILTFAYMWKNMGYMMIIYYSSIVGLSADYFEAASLDGATKWQQIRQITLPLIKGTIITMVILNLGRIVTSDFSLFYQIPKNNGALYSVTQTLDVYVYNALMKNSDFAMSSAASVFQSIVGFIFVLITNAVVRKYNEESALF